MTTATKAAAAAVPKPLARSMFRSALRAAGNGRWADTFAYTDLAVVRGAGAAVAGHSDTPAPHLTFPRSPIAVRKAIRSAFEQPLPEGATVSSAFNCLRNASLTAHALHPRVEALPLSLPSFALPSMPLLPGERSQFHFFEPRYRRMCDIALGRADPPLVLPWVRQKDRLRQQQLAGGPKRWTGPDMRYVHIHEPRGVGVDAPSGVLCTITEHKTLPDGRFVVTVLAGPRVKVLDAFDEELADGEPLRHVNIQLLHDTNENAEANTATPEQIAAWCDECTKSLESLARHTGCLTGRSLPPSNDPEALSFFVLGLLAAGTEHAVHLRRQILSDRNTQPRLEFAMAMLREARKTFVDDRAPNIASVQQMVGKKSPAAKPSDTPATAAPQA
eukprot:CAMPEP_0174851114 /NCGR_PEP_ID=MMETSP1114-20130205/21687_1 /TAXON_ID=312471 /ORGANISM="Neobodo designis, Strain CCAP 1951/1" /LENGTH=387 /DNA_ID=CAMNT_0016085625 /DNA_START=175 /DNA_END=1338 /DNA_ORIENTATION=+